MFLETGETSSVSEVVAVYADGGLIGPTNPSPIGGTFAWCWVDAAGNRIKSDSGVIPAKDGLVSNNQSEYVALCKALAGLPAGWGGKVCSDSQITLGRLFWGWANKGIPLPWLKRAAEIVGRLGKVDVVLLQGHPTKADLAAGIGAKRGFPVSAHNVFCDESCTAAARAYLAEQRAA